MLGVKNSEGEKIIDVFVLNGLSIINSFYKHKENHKWVGYSWNEQHQSIIQRNR